MRNPFSVFLLSMVALLAAASVPSSGQQTHASAVAVAYADYHGWRAITLRSATAEAVIVPEIGRVMQFNLVEQEKTIPGPFWSNPGFGKQLRADSEGWTNYGGDKAWPSPQSDWPKVAGSAWPPPKTFDAKPYRASIHGSRIELLSAIDANYGIRIRRIISLDAQDPVMTIETSYEKVRGQPVQVGVWTITQLVSPDRVFVLLPQHSAFAGGYKSLLKDPPSDVRLDGPLLSLTRNPAAESMVGNDGTALLWVGTGPDLRVEGMSSTTSGDYPAGMRAHIYTNPGDKLAYVELEVLDRVPELKVGQTTTMRNTYTLIRRSESDPLAEARKVFSLK